MKKRHLIVPAAGVLAFAASQASAQIIYEPFDYGSASIGTNVANLTGSPAYKGYINPMNGLYWYDTNTATTGGTPYEVSLISGSMSNSVTPYLQPSMGGMADAPFAGTSSSTRTPALQLAPTAYTSGTLYYSTEFQVHDLAGALAFNAINPDNGAFFVAFANSSGTQTNNPSVLGAKMSIRLDPTDSTSTHYQVGVHGNASPPGLYIAWDTADSFSTSDTVFVVGSYTFDNSSGSGVGESRLWVNPNPTSFGAGTAPADNVVNSLDASDTAYNKVEPNPDQMGELIIRQGNTFVPSWTIDEMRMDTTWAGVTMPKGTTWQGSPGGDFNTNGNWDTAAVPTGVDANGVPSFVNFNDAGAGNVNVSSAITVGTINIRSTTSYNLTGAAISMDGTTGGQGALNVYAENDGTTSDLIGSSHTIANNINFVTATSANIAMGQTLSLTGVVSGAQLLKNGAGTLALTNTSNSFSGDVVIGNGAIAITDDAALGPTSNNVALKGGALRFDAPLSLNASRNISITGAANTEDAGTINTNGNAGTIPGLITGGVSTAALTKIGTGILTLTNTNNSYKGEFIEGGEIAIDSEGAAGATTELGVVPASANVNLWFKNGGLVQINGSFDLNPNRIIDLLSGGGGIDVTTGNTSNLPQRAYGVAPSTRPVAVRWSWATLERMATPVPPTSPAASSRSATPITSVPAVRVTMSMSVAAAPFR